MSRTVWHKRFHGDALNGYMGLSLEERGAYTTLLDLMYDSDWEIGIPDRERWVAGHLNVSTRRWNALRKSLLEAGKIDIVDGFISNFRYRKERENALNISRKRAENGASGGDKSGEVRRKYSKIKAAPEANASDLPLYARATYSDTEADKKDSEAKASGAEAPLIDPAKVMFDAGILLLGAAGIDERKARGIIGKWKMGHGVEATIAALGNAKREGATEPVSFIEGIFRRNRNEADRTSRRPNSTDGFANALRIAANRGNP